jgi:hypothetical protein
MMAMQLLRGKPSTSSTSSSSSSSAAASGATAEGEELRSLRQQLSESQTAALELQLEQVCKSAFRALTLQSLTPQQRRVKAAHMQLVEQLQVRLTAARERFENLFCHLIVWQVARCSVTDLTVRLEQVLMSRPPLHPRRSRISTAVSSRSRAHVIPHDVPG